jgi:hypothetical protein
VEIERIDLGICRAYEYAGDPGRTAVVLPGAMLGGTPANSHLVLALVEDGWRVVQVWDEYDGGTERVTWAVERAEAAIAHAGQARLLAGKSLGSLATQVAADRGLAGIWLTPLLPDAACAEGLRARTAPALLVGGTEDHSWDHALAYELGDEVLELDGADHGLAKIEHLPALVDAVRAFSGRLGA